jgi:hypothetical protein
VDVTGPKPAQSADGLGPDRDVVLRHLANRFPEVDAFTVERVVDQAAEATAGAKIQAFRPLLVEHRAGDQLLKLRQAANRLSVSLDAT